MMRLLFSGNEVQSDLQVGTSGLLRDASLETAVIISLFSDARAANDDLLPDGRKGNDYRADRKGWAGDAIAVVAGDALGSKLWLLSREKQTEETRRRAETMAKDSLLWLLEDGQATDIKIVASWIGRGVLSLDIKLTLANEDVFAKNFVLRLNTQIKEAA